MATLDRDWLRATVDVTGLETNSSLLDLTIASPQGTFFLIWVILMWIFSFPVAILFWKHSSEHPINGRHPRLMLLALFLFLIFVSIVNVDVVYPTIYQCEAFIVVTVVVFGQALWVMFVRVWAIFFLFMTTYERARPKGNTDKEGWYISHRWWASTLALQVYTVLGFFVLGGVAVAIALLDGSSTAAGVEGCAGRAAVFIFMGAEVVLLGSFFGVIAYVLRKTAKDSLYIKTELTAIAIVCFVAVAAFLPLSLIDATREFANTTFSFPSLICSLTAAFVVIVCLIYPLSKLHLASDDDGPEKETLTLFECLDHVDGRESFREFLITEFSVENILVLDDIRYFKELVKSVHSKHGTTPPKSYSTLSNLVGGSKPPQQTEGKDDIALDIFKGTEDGEKILTAARALYKRYIVAGAPDQVNLPSATVMAVQQEMMVVDGSAKVWDGSVFDQVKFDIEQLCRRDTFPRYCRSPMGKAFKEKMGKEQLSEKRRGLLLHFCKLFGLCCLACCAGILSLCAF